MAKNITNKELAKKLGLSSTLVSLVLNNKADQQGIKKETQEKVLFLATQMGYFDNLSNQNLISPVEEKPGVMGMIVTSIDSPFIYSITPYLQKAFATIGVGFSVITKDCDDERHNRMINAFRKFYSGLILVGEAADENTIRTLRKVNFPFVILEKNLDNLHLNTITSDNNAGAVLVTNHLDRLGYKNILIVTDDKNLLSDSLIINELCRAIKQKNGMSEPSIVKIRKPETGNLIDYSLFENYLRSPYSAEILIVLHADLVYNIILTLQNKKMRIPQDVAIISMEEGIGFDLIQSPVTCLRKPVERMALKVANMLWSEVKNSGKSKFKRQITMTPELITRNSC